jgi:hypothetical protein
MQRKTVNKIKLPVYIRRGYLKFSAWLVTNVLLEQKKIKLLNKRYFVESKVEFIKHDLKNAGNFPGV